MSEREQRYKILGLSHNPFPIQAVEQEIIDPRKDLLDDVSRFCAEIREREMQWVHNKVIQPLIGEGECPNVWVAGRRGVGKSALLKYIVHSLFDTSILSLYVKKPLKGLPEIYTKAIRYLGVDFFVDLSLAAYLEFFKQIEAPNARFISPPRQPVIDYVLDDVSRLSLFMRPTDEGTKKLRERNISPESINLLKMTTSISAWLVAKCNILVPKFATMIAKFPIDPEEQFLKLMKLPRAEQIDCLVSIILLAGRTKGYSAGLLVIDELDQVWEDLGTGQKRKIGLDARKIYESGRGKIKLIGTSIGEDMWKDFEKITYMADAIPVTPDHILEVFEFDAEQTKRLAAHYLNKARLPGTEGFTEPFTDTVIIAVNKRFGGNARAMLQDFRGLIEIAAEKGYSTVDEKALVEYNPVYQEILPIVK